jgi:hypothetical protein
MQVSYVFLQVLAIFRSRHLINARRGVFSQLVKGFREEVLIHVMSQRGEHHRRLPFRLFRNLCESR